MGDQATIIYLFLAILGGLQFLQIFRRSTGSYTHLLNRLVSLEKENEALKKVLNATRIELAIFKSKLKQTDSKLDIYAGVRAVLEDRLLEEEVDNLIWDVIGTNTTSISVRDNHATKVRKLVTYIVKRGELDRLDAWLRENRPDIDLTLI